MSSVILCSETQSIELLKNDVGDRVCACGCVEELVRESDD